MTTPNIQHLYHDEDIHKRYSYNQDLKSLFLDPFQSQRNYYHGILTIPPWYGRAVSFKTLRRIAEKAWILNLCIQNVIKKIRPFLKPTTDENQRGFRIKKTHSDHAQALTPQEQRTIANLEQFFLNTGTHEDPDRGTLDRYVAKLVRDICNLDQTAVELQRTNAGTLAAFWAIDPATIEVAMPESYQETGIRYVQVIQNIPYAFYTDTDLLFECMNPRSDIEHAGYGYSLVEQAIDLVTSSINTFMYNSGFFTEDKLPRGVLLLQGDVDEGELEMMEDYLANLMSGPPTSKWKVPIVPSGITKGNENKRTLEWVSFQANNREMEFQAWYDLQLSGLTAIFGLSVEDVGLHSQKSQPLIGADTSPKIESNKSLVLGDMLGFFQQHFNRILREITEDYTFEFVGYERDDPKLTLDIDKGEIETYKSIDDKRREKGLEPYKEVWSMMPLNPHAVQLYLASQQSQGGGEGEDAEEDEAYEGLDFSEEDGDSMQESEENNESESAPIEKAIQQNRKTIRIRL
jgi:hypothetical protein